MKSLFTKYIYAFGHCWQSPGIRIDEEQDIERKASWLELFYDLIFVAFIASAAHKLVSHISGFGVLEYVLIFIPAWWVWIASTYYNERFENDDVSHRFFTFLKMIPLALLAYSVNDAFGSSSKLFAFSYACLRVIHIVMWLRAGRKDAITKKVSLCFALGFGVSALLWFSSIIVDIPWRFVLWAIGLLIDLVTPLPTISLQARMPKLSKSHLPERFGLLTLLALGESVIGVVNGAALRHIDLVTGIIAVLGLILAFFIWWIYFDHIIFRPFHGGIWWILAWTYAHFPLVIAITAMGAGITNIVSNYSSAVLIMPIRLLICASLALILLVMGIINLASEGKYLHDKVNVELCVFKIVGAIFCLVIGFFKLNTITMLLLLIAILFVQILQGIYFKLKEEVILQKATD